MAEVNNHWLDRLNALGRAQSRYLWVLLVACLFYAALRSALHGPQRQEQPTLQVPVVDLILDPMVVLASGSAVISLLVLIITGSLRAYSTARSNLGAGSGADAKAERYDLHPNAIDLAVYTTIESPRWLAVAAYFVYPLLLAFALVEAVALGRDLVDGALRQVTGRSWFLVLAIVLWAVAAWQVVAITIRRIKNASKIGRPPPGL